MPGNLASAIVPDEILDAFRVVSPDPLPLITPPTLILVPTKSFFAIPTPPLTLKAPEVLSTASRVEVTLVNESSDVDISISSPALSPVAIFNFVFSPVSA